jgi:hypothetical protein
MNFLIANISRCSNPEESAFPKGLIGFDHSIEIWLAEVARVSRPLVLAKMNDFAKRKGGLRNVVQLVHSETIPGRVERKSCFSPRQMEEVGNKTINHISVKRTVFPPDRHILKWR